MNAPFWGGVFMTALSAYLLKHAIKRYRQFSDSAAWPSTEGRITESEVVRYDATTSRYDFLVRYSYNVDGRDYTHNVATLYTLSGKAECEALLEKFPAGTNAPVYYDPQNPQDAVLVTGADARKGKEKGELILGTAALIGGLTLCVAGYMGWLD